MTVVDSVAEWVQVALNAGALVTGGVIWKMYFSNLKATIGTKEAEASLAGKQVDYWRDRATELEKRSPEAVERVLADRIKIREDEIGRLAEDRERNAQELQQVEREVGLFKQVLDATRGFRQVLAMEQPVPGDPDYDDYVKYLQDNDGDEAAEVEVVYLGAVGVDSGQLLITDPCYIDAQWIDEPFKPRERAYKDATTGVVVRWGQDFTNYQQELPTYNKTPNELIESGQLEALPAPRPDMSPYKYSYDGACRATSSDDGFGELIYTKGHTGAGVAIQSGWGDGFYPVYGEKHDGRIMRVYINLGVAPSAPVLSPPPPTAG